MARKLKGIRQVGQKWEVYVKVAGKFRSTTFDELDVPKMRQWQDAQRSTVAPPPDTGSFLADVQVYLKKPVVAAMPYVDQKATHLALALEALGSDRSTGSITSDEVEALIQTWLKAGLAPATVYHRRSSLSAFFTMHNGASGANPVRGTTKPEPWTPRDQSVSRASLLEVLAAMPDERRPMKGIRQPSTARIVVRVLMETGVRGGDLVKVTRRDVDWTAGTVTMPRSAKGKGAKSWTCLLTPDGLDAMRAFDLANLYGAFNPAAVSHSFKRAARRVLGRDTGVHLYSLRHSLGTDLYRIKGDLATVGRILGHTEGSTMTAQYSRGAHVDVDRAALAALAASRGAAVAPAKLGEKLGRLPKLVKRNKIQRAS